MPRTTHWTEERISDGFKHFYRRHNRLPTAHEVDELENLPSSRHIQRKFGGLEQLRSQLGFKHTHLGKGRFRSKIARKVNKQGRLAETELELILCQRFGEVFVHTEKMYGGTRNRIDFYLYTPSGNFGIDIFHPTTLKTMRNNVYIKVLRYCDFKETLYLAVANEKISQAELDSYINAKKNSMPENIKLVTLETLVSIINKMKVYDNPLI